MKVIIVLLNVFLCPIGTFVAGKPVAGVIQLIMMVLAFFLTLSVFGAIIGLPIGFVAWIWGLIVAVGYKEKDSNVKTYS